MGEPMAAALLRAGFAVQTCAHANRAPLERLVALGASDAGDPAGVGAGSDVVITMVPDAPQVEEALFAAQGATSRAKPGTLFIDMSTISPVASKAFDARLRATGFRFIDAPVSGGPARATSGTLTLMVGAQDADLADARDVLSAMGTPTHVGTVGMGETVKLANQIIISSIMIANAEGLMFAAKAGVDVNVAREVIMTATGGNYLLEHWVAKGWIGGTFTPGFTLDLLRKDIAAGLDTARAMGMPLPLAGLAYQMYTATSAEGYGNDDYTSVARFYERATGIKLSKTD